MESETVSVGVFDSGFGGLDIFREIVNQLPQYSYLYFADSARAPYGPRTKEEVLEFTKQGVEFLFAKGAHLVLLACNTSSSDALRIIQEILLPCTYPDKKVLGVLVPAAEESVQVSVTGKIGVIGTQQTISSNSFNREIVKLRPDAQIYTQACPKLVPLIEQGDVDSDEMMNALREYILPLVAEKIDTLVLGCTHYGLIQKQIRKIVGEGIPIVRESEVVPRSLKNYLARHPEIHDTLSRTHRITFYTTDQTDRFEKIGSQFWGSEIRAEHISLL